MINIKISQAARQEINKMHKAYVEEIVAPILEDKISKVRKDKKFLKKLFGDTGKARTNKITRICLSDEIEAIKDEFSRYFNDIYGFEFIDAKTPDQIEVTNRVKKKINVILNYAGFNAGRKLESGETWNRHKFIADLGIRVCPYCNRQYITSYRFDSSNERTTADADHYYPKDQYPILQMNIYNLIPSCNVCNSKTKLNKDIRHLYPYEDSSDSLTFQIPLDTVDDVVNGNVNEIKISTRDNTRAKGSNEVFKLDKIYQAHTDIATEIKRDVSEYINVVGIENPNMNCKDYYKKTMGIEVSYSGTMYDVLFRFMEKDLSTEPLLKLKQDVFNQIMVTQMN